MNTPQPTLLPAQAAPQSAAAGTVEEKKPEGIEHDPYVWGQCAITANIVWLPDGAVMLGVRNHLDAPIISVLASDTLITLPGHAVDLPIPAAEAIADLLAQLREELPLRAKAKADRDEATRRKAEETKNKATTGKKSAKSAPAKAAAPIPASAATPTPVPVPANQHPVGKVPLAGKVPPVGKVPLAGKTPSGNQISMFNFITGGN